jgi:hypothetical protein
MANWNSLNHYIFSNMPQFIKTVPEKERPNYIEDRLSHYPRKFVTDYSRFESTFREELLELEHHIYRYYGMPNWCLWPMIGENILIGETGSAKIEDKRMSGEMNTSLGNSLMNFFFVYHVMSERGLKYGVDWDGVFEGDDGLIGSVELPTSNEFWKIGCDIDIAEIDSLGDGGFCGLFYGESLSPLVGPQHSMQALWSLTCPDLAGPAVKSELLNGKLLSLVHRAPGCPIAHTICRRYMRGKFRIVRDYWSELLLERYGISTEKDAGYWIRGSADVVVPEPTMNQRLDYEKLFKVPVALQFSVEKGIERGDWSLFTQVVADFNPHALVAAEYVDRLELNTRCSNGRI